MPRPQVMKMVMPLLAPAAGVLRPQVIGGAVIKAGDLIARLELDNPAAQAQVRPPALPGPGSACGLVQGPP